MRRSSCFVRIDGRSVEVALANCAGLSVRRDAGCECAGEARNGNCINLFHVLMRSDRAAPDATASAILPDEVRHLACDGKSGEAQIRQSVKLPRRDQ